MGERTSYPEGTFSWAELATGDAAAAKSFYAALFGWEYDDRPIGEGQVYSVVRRDGKDVAALYSTTHEPPHWNSYVTVDSADAATNRAQELGANAISEPFDVMDIGRMSVIADPAGAVLCLWEARGNIGAGLVNGPGLLTWNDLITPDPDAAIGFYNALFGWTTEEIPDSGGYRFIRHGDRNNGGVLPLDPRQVGLDTPAVWIPYFGHEDAERLAAEVGGLGGRVVHGPMRIGPGSVAALADPQGAAFSVWTGPYAD